MCGGEDRGTTTRQFLTGLSCCTFLGCFIALSVLMGNYGKIKSEFANTNEMVLRLKQEWQAPMITDLQVVPASQKCKDVLGPDAFEPFAKVFMGVHTMFVPPNSNSQ